MLYEHFTAVHKMITTNSTELKNILKDRKTAVALGSFDALHKGHIYVIGKAVEYAKKNNLTALVQLVEIPTRLRINTLETKLDILEKMGVEVVVVEQFTESFRSVNYKSFICEFLSDKYNAAAVFCGDNYRFGYMAEGDTDKLSEGCSKCGISVNVIPCVEIEGVVSSTVIREFIKNGDMEKAAEYMTRPYSVSGKVVHGRGLGKTLGFPTANISIPPDAVIPKNGVYLTQIRLDGKIYDGITNVGAKPTVGVDEVNIETYIDQFDGDIYGKTIMVEFKKRLRDIKKFDSLEELKAQIEKDKTEI